MNPDEIRALRVGKLVLAGSLACWMAISWASWRIPSPARESRFVLANGRAPRDRIHCHGMLAIDDEVAWSVCGSFAETAENYLGRFSTEDGTWTLLGPLATHATGLGGAIVGATGERVFLIGDELFEARGDTIRALGSAGIPLGLARVGRGVELVDRTGPGGLAVSRFELGQRVARRELQPDLRPAEGRVRQAVSAFFEDASWHVLTQEYARQVASLPLEVTLRVQEETGAGRVVGVVALGDTVVQRDEDGAVGSLPPWLIAGSLVSGSAIAREMHVYRSNRIERVAFDGSPFVDVVATVMGEGPHARPIVGAISERQLRSGDAGPRYGRLRVRGRFDALRVDGRTGPPVVASFWMDGGFRVVPLREGAYLMLGALGGSYVRLGPDLRRTDALSVPERFVRLFVEDRAKRNSDYLDGLGVLRVATVPWMLLGVFVGLSVVLAGRLRPRLASGIGMTWMALAVAGTWHFVYVLRYFW